MGLMLILLVSQFNSFYQAMQWSTEIYSNLKEILIRENRYELYEKAISCIQTRVDLDLASFTDDIWSH